MQIWSCRTVFGTHNVRMCFVYCLRCSTVMDSYMLRSTQGRCIRNWQDIGFGLSPILSNKTTVKMLATETPVIVRTKKEIFPHKGVTLCKDSCILLTSTLLVLVQQNYSHVLFFYLSIRLFSLFPMARNSLYVGQIAL